MTGEVSIRFVGENVAEHPDTRQPGDACWTDHGGVTRLLFVCPCGCGRFYHLNVAAAQDPRTWAWNGDREKPTLTPSILDVGGCRWHGYLTDGVFKSC